MPPPIHRTITVSADAFGASAPATARGNPAARADSVAAPALFRKSRRVQFELGFIKRISSINQLEFRLHGHGPEQVFHTFAAGRLADEFQRRFPFGCGWQ